MSTRYAWMLVPLCLFSIAGVAGAQEERRAPADRQELSISGRVLVTNGLPPEDMAVYLGNGHRVRVRIWVEPPGEDGSFYIRRVPRGIGLESASGSW